MKSKPPLVLMILILLLASSAAGSGWALALPAQPELQTLPVWEYHGTVQGEWLGIAVAGAGKVNGDAFSDLLVGAYKGGTNREGWVGLFLGSAAGPQPLPAWQVFGEHKGGEFGGALDFAGDVNHDGYDDILIGAANYSGEAPSDEAGEGAVYLYYGADGGAELNARWKIEGNLQGVRLGAAVAGAGYINGDDYADVIVGSSGYNNGELANAGAAYVFFGSEDGLIPSYGWMDVGEQASGQYGLEVNAAGDVNGDGYDDVLVGEPYHDHDIYLDIGMVYLYLGNQFSLSNVPAWTYMGYRGGDRLGISATGVGDLNGDGCDDIAIGAPGFNTGTLLDTGRAYVFYGCQATASGLPDIPDWGYSTLQANANTGIDVSGGGDTNGDGYAELLVGVHLFDDEQANEGAVMVFFGSAGGLALEPGWGAEGNKNDTFFGFAVDTAGDTNNDGMDDALIGAPMYRVEEDIKGAAFVYFGTPYVVHYLNFIPFIRR
jgi:hypothetical protein